MRTEATLLINGVPVGRADDVKVTYRPGKYAQRSVIEGETYTLTMSAKWPGALSFVQSYFDEPPKLTLADAVRIQSVRWHSFVLWYATGKVTWKMYPRDWPEDGDQWWLP